MQPSTWRLRPSNVRYDELSRSGQRIVAGQSRAACTEQRIHAHTYAVIEAALRSGAQ